MILVPSLVLSLLSMTAAVLAPPEDRLPHVLILGDSISMGYTPFVRSSMEGEAVIIRPTRENGKPENCAGTTKGIANVDRWLNLGDGRWDVIHFNFGLHDLKRVHPETGKNSLDPAHPNQAPPDVYEAQLREIVAKLKATGAELIYATTTPVPPGGVRPHRDVDDPPRYNAIAAKIMGEHGIPVNDLFAFASARLKEIQQPVNVHFTKDGSRRLGDQVESALRKALGLATRSNRPNILWIVVEDMSAHFGCYGETTIVTPNVDRLAEQGVRFTKAFVTAPVCSSSRSAMITGMYQSAIGCEHHRSGRGEKKIELPAPVEPIPLLFQRAGYYTCNGNASFPARKGKTDYNFQFDPAMYDGPDWSGRKKGQPFFAQIQLRGGKLRHGKGFAAKAKKDLGSLTLEDQVQLPPYYPRDSVVLADWARYLDAVRYTDWELGRILERLEKEGLSETTYVFFMTDHGISHARGKQFCYDEGIHIPFIVRGPNLTPRVEERLVAHIDMGATSLRLAGLEIPEWMQGRDVLSGGKPREVVFSARDRCDETVDRIRSVRTDRFKYIVNGFPSRPYLQPNAYKDHKPILRRLRELGSEGRLDPVQALILAETRPAEELYDLHADPFETKNLASAQEYADVLKDLRAKLQRCLEQSRDRGGERASMYDSDMAVYLGGIKRRNPKRAAVIDANIRLMKKWASQGK